jgi:hypothetical protein
VSHAPNSASLHNQIIKDFPILDICSESDTTTIFNDHQNFRPKDKVSKVKSPSSSEGKAILMFYTLYDVKKSKYFATSFNTHYQ